jgi:hypothetical protein
MIPLFVLALAIAAAAATARPEVAAAEARKCWPEPLLALVNASIEAGTEDHVVDDARLGAFFLRLATHLRALRPLCMSYALAATQLLGLWRTSTTQAVAPLDEYVAHCRALLPDSSTAPLPQMDPLVQCILGSVLVTKIDQ